MKILQDGFTASADGFIGEGCCVKERPETVGKKSVSAPVRIGRPEGEILHPMDKKRRDLSVHDIGQECRAQLDDLHIEVRAAPLLRHDAVRSDYHHITRFIVAGEKVDADVHATAFDKGDMQILQLERIP